MLGRIARRFLPRLCRRVRIVGMFRHRRNMAPRLRWRKGGQGTAAPNYRKGVEGTVRHRVPLTRREFLAFPAALPLAAATAAASVAKAERDGYSIMYDATAHSVNPSLYANLPYDTVKDFQPVFLGAIITNLMLANKSVEAQSVADVIVLAKATPGGLDWASSGNGTVQHLALEMFRHRAGIKLNHIPYRGGGPALNDLIGGQVKFFSPTPPLRSATSRRAPSNASPPPAAAGSRRFPTCRRSRKG